MYTMTSALPKKRKLDILLIGVPFLIVFLLCFIDEGYYDLRWMLEPGNWVAFGLYWIAMVLGEFFVSLVLPREWPTRQKVWLILGLGIPLGILLVLVFLSMVTGYSF